MRKPAVLVAWVLAALVAAVVAAGCGWGVAVESLLWTREDPAPADLVGTWRVPEEPHWVAEAHGVDRVPVRLTLAGDGTAEIVGDDLIHAERTYRGGSSEERMEAAWVRVRAGEDLPVRTATWEVVSRRNGQRKVALRFPDGSTLVLGMWGRGPPYRLFGWHDFADPDEGNYLFLERDAAAADAPVGTPPPAAPAPPAPAAPDTPVGWSGDDPAVAEFGPLTVVVVLLILAVLAFVAVVVAVVAAVVAVAALAAAAAALLALCAGGAVGIAATSVVVGLAKRSLASGFRTLATLAAAVPGAVAGTAAAWTLRRLVAGPFHGPTWSLGWTLALGCVAGAAAGGVAGRLAALCVERIARWTLARLRPPRLAPSPPAAPTP